MKQYQITLGVPDDFNPEELDMTVSYKDDIEILSEGFTDIADIKEKLQAIVDNCELSTIEPKENDIVLFKFDELTSAEEAKSIMFVIEEKTGRPALGMSKSLDVLIEDANATVEMLNGMIAKVKTRAAVKETSKIVLPN